METTVQLCENESVIWCGRYSEFEDAVSAFERTLDWISKQPNADTLSVHLDGPNQKEEEQAL